VKTTSSDKALASFCEQTFPASGSEARKWMPPPERALPGDISSKPEGGAGWTWINLWASWCGPCVEEMPLLERWTQTLRTEGVPVRIEAWSIDEEEAEFQRALSRKIPGHIRWLAGPEHLEPFLRGLGVSADSAIPIHALVDPKGMIRCVRVGAVGGEAYGVVKAILSKSS
jgi:thiol-disulfide isomerase/thioredoxin